MANAARRIPPAITPSDFTHWAPARGYCLAPAVLPTPDRVYADLQTQAAFEAWTAGAASVAPRLTESTP